jgi:hypothetical protein
VGIGIGQKEADKFKKVRPFTLLPVESLTSYQSSDSRRPPLKGGSCGTGTSTMPTRSVSTTDQTGNHHDDDDDMCARVRLRHRGTRRTK